MIIAGALIRLKTLENIGIYIICAGFMGLAVSGTMMGMTYGVPEVM